MRKTKIVCTLGPATNDAEIIKELIGNGLDAARINFSHGTYESLKVIINRLKEAREALNAPIPLILDTKGPEIRIKEIENNCAELKTGETFTLTTRDIIGNEKSAGITYKDLPGELSRDARILIDDGLIELRVKSVSSEDIECEIVNGGVISSNKGINIPDVYVGLPSLTEKDIADIKFGIEEGFDYIAASFIRKASDVTAIRRLLEENGGNKIAIISKIENRDGVNNIDEILEVSDGIMVARGDLGVEIPPEEVPLVQKMLIKKAHKLSKPVITATQMLESMIVNPRPKRAEASDVANAIFDGSDSIMLSGETAKGSYPIQAVAMMSRIAEKTESSIDYIKELSDLNFEQSNITSAISYAACATAAELNAVCISTITKSGFTARIISKFRPFCPIAASSSDPVVWRQLNLVWGCRPVLVHELESSSEAFPLTMRTAVESGVAKNGDTVVVAMGVPVGISGTTNTLRVGIVGDVLCKGTGVGKKTVSARARVINTLDEAEKKFKMGDILVTNSTRNDMMPYIKKASAIVVGPIEHTEGSHAEIVGNALDIPVVMCNSKVTSIIPDDTIITVNAGKGFIYEGIPTEE